MPDVTRPTDEPRALLYIGIDDTDTSDSPGTNQLARQIANDVTNDCAFEVVLRHQLLQDPRVPFTSQNGCASILLNASSAVCLDDVVAFVRDRTRSFSPIGSDPGICVAARVPKEIEEFGLRCQREVVRQDEARAVATAHAIHLEGLGGTGDGIIGALAAVGLLSAGDDGRVVHAPGWPWPDPLRGICDVEDLLTRGVDEIRDVSSGTRIHAGRIDLGNRLRPAYRSRRIVLFVRPVGAGADDRGGMMWEALKLN